MRPKAKAVKPKVNSDLRRWTRGLTFNLTMGKRQVFNLVVLHLWADSPYGTAPHRYRHAGDFVHAAHCLLDRGLIVAHIWGKAHKRLVEGRQDEQLLKEYWALTRAGELVVELLKEAGIYEEVKAELEAANQLKVRIA